MGLAGWLEIAENKMTVVAAVLLVSTRAQFVVVTGRGPMGNLLKIQRGAFLLRSNGFLTILSLRELQWGVILVYFALFYCCFLIF